MAQGPLGSEILAKIINGSSIPSFVINNNHKVIYWNTAMEALSGIKREKIIGTDEQWRAFYKEKRPVMADLIMEGVRVDKLEAHYTGIYKKSRLIDGAYEAEDFFPDLGRNGKWLHFTASPIRDDDGEIAEAIETLEDITERKRAEEALYESEKSLRYYLQQITRAQEEERKRIARELHDDTAQLLGSLSRQLDNFTRGKHGLGQKETAFLKDMQAQLNRGVQDVHRFIHDLLPPILDALGLIPAVRSLVKDLHNSGGTTAELKVHGDERRFTPEVELLLFRIVQEALNNVVKHAKASEAVVTIDFSREKVTVTVSDNGRGFEALKLYDLPRASKLGLVGIQERTQLLGGTLEMKSAPGKGTTLTVDVPV